MELLSQWAFGVCCAAVAGGITQLVLPNSPMQKIYRVVVGAFFVCCTLVPLMTVLPRLTVELDPFPQAQAQELTEELAQVQDQLLRDQVEEALTGQVEEKLEKMSINGAAVHIHFSTEPGTVLEAEHVTVEVILPEGYRPRHDELAKSLEYQLGLAVRLGYR